jgi:uncharacterized membrane-anchored protein
MTDATSLPSNSTSRSIPSWRFWVPLIAQAAIILAVPVQALYTQISGETLVLQVVPVDPYDIMRGYSVTLSYNISLPDRLKELPGWETLIDTEAAAQGQTTEPQNGQPIYVVLQAPNASEQQPPAAWTPVAVNGDRPTDLPDNQRVIKGIYRYGQVFYGLETYYIPEDQRNDINNEISALQLPAGVPPEQRPENPPIVVETKVDAQGNAVPITVWLSDRQYTF